MDSMELFRFFDNASTGVPLRFTSEVILILREILSDGGIDLDVDEETKASLRETQFRSLDQGRGVGVAKVLGHSLANRLVEYCAYAAGIYQGKRIKSAKTGEPIEGTQGRGLQQALADTLAIAIMPEEADEFERRLNRRLWRWMRSNQGQMGVSGIDANFSAYGDVPTARTASVPPRAVALLWSYLQTQI